MATAEKPQRKKQGLLNQIDWIEFGMKFSALVLTSYVGGYVSSLASDHRQSRKAKRLSKKDSNVLQLKKAN